MQRPSLARSEPGEELLASFRALLGDLFVDAGSLAFVSELGVGELALVERGLYYPPNGARPVSVVVKGYSPHVIATPEDLRALLEEARNIQRLNHRNLVKLYGLGCFHHSTPDDLRGSLFMVEEFVGTMSLKALLRLQRRTKWRWLYSMHTAVRWAAALASALAALHAAEPPYIHGDVKAINVFLTDSISVDSAVAKLGDLKPHRHVYDKAPSLLREHQEATLEMTHESLKRQAMKDRSKKAAAKWQGGRPVGRKSVDMARAEWEAHTANSSDSGSHTSSFGGRSSLECPSGVSVSSTPRASAVAAAAAAAANIESVPEEATSAAPSPRPGTPFEAVRVDAAEQQQRIQGETGLSISSGGAIEQQQQQNGVSGGSSGVQGEGGTRSGPLEQLQQQQNDAGTTERPVGSLGEANLDFETRMFSGRLGSGQSLDLPAGGRIPSYVIAPGSSRQFGLDSRPGSVPGSRTASIAGLPPAAPSSGSAQPPPARHIQHPSQASGVLLPLPPGLPSNGGGAAAAAAEGVVTNSSSLGFLEPVASGDAEPPNGNSSGGGAAPADAEALSRRRSILKTTSSLGGAPMPDALMLRPSRKSVTFELARAKGVTSNRDWGLLYASPELLRKRELTPAADVFAFGVLLYELLTRRLVSYDDDGTEAQAEAYERSVRGGRINLEKHGDESLQLLAYAERVADGYRPPLPSHWPEAVTDLVERCWAAEREERPSMAEVQEALNDVMKDRKTLRQLDAEPPPVTPDVTTCACTIA